jgi:hypothetical protein
MKVRALPRDFFSCKDTGDNMETPVKIDFQQA